MSSPVITPAWLTLKQASTYCGLSVRTLQTRADEGAFETTLRGVRLIKRESLDGWLVAGVGEKGKSPRPDSGSATISKRRKGGVA